ncbi:MAG TPA: thiamine ABC transporter substrate-binding protein [Acidimicrobiia bacterium]|nr:thiamine ABC transporter substrate-binding protein [Acidimicrobiia bacterium]
MRYPKTLTPLALALAVTIAACGSSEETEVPETLAILSHDSFADGVTDETFAAFTAETGIAVEVIPAGDAGSLVNQAALTKDNPLADVLFGVDDTFLSRAIEEGVFTHHVSADIETVDPDLRDTDDLVTPIDFGDVCFNYDKEWFATNGATVPTDLESLTDSDVAPLVTVEHPATSSPGLAFMLATIDVFGEEGWLDWWEAMRDGGINIANDWDTAYYGDFTRYGGTTPIVMSYASSPPAEVIFAEEPLAEAPTGVIEAGCYRQVEYAGVLDGTAYPESAGLLVDFMLSVDFQEGIPLTWFVFPANSEASLPQEFVDHTTIPEDPTRIDPGTIAENRDRWIDEWIAVMEG